MARIVAAEVEDVMGIEMVIIGAMEVNIMMARRIGAIEKVADEGNQEIRVVRCISSYSQYDIDEKITLNENSRE